MVGARHQFSGMRTTNASSGGRVGAASELMRLEMQKKGKLPAAQRYKRLMRQKLEENKKEALGASYKKPFSFSDKIGGGGKMSARAEQALKEIAMKKAAKLAKEEREMVIVQPRNYANGRLTKKGDICDVAGNVIGKVNTKNGKMTTNNGWGFGRYKPKSMMTDMKITDAINKHSPYLIQQRKMQLLEQQAGYNYGVHGNMMADDVINVHGKQGGNANPYGYNTEGQEGYSAYGTNVAGPRQNIGVTAWGAQSDNVWGSYTDNAWGVSTDNVWGSNSTDIWGGIGAGNLWANSGVKIFGTGNGRNYLRGLFGFVGALFGLSFSSKKNRTRLAALNKIAQANAQRTSSRGSSATMRSARSR
ncbi:MAG: hypothetical protein ACN2B6_03370 [Rickettsiales bacterium]